MSKCRNCKYRGFSHWVSGNDEGDDYFCKIAVIWLKDRDMDNLNGRPEWCLSNNQYKNYLQIGRIGHRE
ncbi:MAG: hypothetical protein WDA47_03810 [Bacilli bacterium]